MAQNHPALAAAEEAPMSPNQNSLFQQQSALHTNPWSVGTSVMVNGGILALLLCIGLGHKPPLPIPGSIPHINLRDFTIFAPPIAASSHGGNGGGNHDLIAPIEGRTPPVARSPIVPPQVQALDKPLLAINPAIAVPPDVKLPDNPTLLNLGVYRSSNTVVLSNGPGAEAGIGTGKHGGVGPGTGTPVGASTRGRASISRESAASLLPSLSSSRKPNSPTKPAVRSTRASA
jgi:periplasmic protein TonB